MSSGDAPCGCTRQPGRWNECTCCQMQRAVTNKRGACAAIVKDLTLDNHTSSHQPAPMSGGSFVFAEAGDHLRLLVVHMGPYVGRRSCQSRHPWGAPATSKDSLVLSRPAPAHTNRSTGDQNLMEYLTGSSWNGEASFNVLRELPQVFRTSIIHLPHLQANCRFGTYGETLEPGAEKKVDEFVNPLGHLRHQQRIPCPCSMQPCLSQSVGSGKRNEFEF